MDREIELFIQDYLKEIREDNAAIFAGAGLSAPAGFVNWRDLLRPIAEELRLDVDKEHDLVAVAQYHCNENGGHRHKLNQLLIEQLTVGAIPTDNHRILARLPISTYWTTNYDRLIETALKDTGKIADVKYVTEHLATTKSRRDAVVYKMHGDVEHPHDAVLIKDDYEKYHMKRGAFINALSGDLVSKTFLFIGFSFTDPNLDYVLSRVRVNFRENQRGHYCVFKKRTKQSDESDAEFENAQIKQRLAIADLKRFNIKTLLIDEYTQITEILARIERQYRQRTIFISGSAEEYGAWTKAETEELQKSFSSSASQVLREAVRASSTEEKFDVFLSHSSEDSEIVLGVREILVGLGLTVYIDWIDDPQLDRGSVTAENADMLRRRMRASKSLIFLTTKNSVTSRWMPWELGYFDGHKTGFIGVLPIVDYSGGTFSGQEYLGLYPLVEKLPLTDGGTRFCVVERARKGYRFLDDFAHGQATIRAFSG